MLNAGKKAIMVIGVIILLLVVVVIAIAFFVIQGLEKQKNMSKTQPMRDARWPRKETPLQNSEEQSLPQDKPNEENNAVI